MGLSPGSPGNSVFKVQTDTYTSTTTGTIVDGLASVYSHFTLSVKTTGAVVSWIVTLETSVDGVNFTPVLTHTDFLGKGVCLFSGTLSAPSLYFRTNCQVLVLGLGTSITATAVGTP